MTTGALPEAERSPVVKEQFDDIEQQRDANAFGMWVFLATEVLLFAGLFLSYTVYRVTYPTAFQAGSHRTDFALGTINTGVLLTSSLTMALAVAAAQAGRLRRVVLLFFLLTILLGTAFLVIKGAEYHAEWQEHLVPGLRFDLGAFPAGEAPHAALFFILYFLMTGLHAIHLTIAIGILAVLIVQTLRGKISAENSSPVEVSGLFWHLVDVVWVFLYPLFYLVGHR